MCHDEGPHSNDNVYPRTVALDESIKSTVQRLKNQPDGKSPDTLLLIGKWHQAVPTPVFEDSLLELVDSWYG